MCRLQKNTEQKNRRHYVYDMEDGKPKPGSPESSTGRDAGF